MIIYTGVDVPVDVTNPTTHPIFGEWIVTTIIIGILIGILFFGIILAVVGVIRNIKINDDAKLTGYNRQMYGRAFISAIPVALFGFLLSAILVIPCSIAYYAANWDRYRQIISRS